MEWIFCFKLEEWLDEYGLRSSLNFVEYLNMIYDNPLNCFCESPVKKCHRKV